MDLDWQPTVHSHLRVTIPVAKAAYDPRVRDLWKRAAELWHRSDHADCAVFGDYGALARTGRFMLPSGGERANRFAEVHIASLLEREGFMCWGGVRFFNYEHQGWKGNSEANTEQVRVLSRGSWPWPSDIQQALGFQPRNPDLVAYHACRQEWRFCEVKGWGDRVNDLGQLGALGVLHLLTGAPVAVVHLVPDGHRMKSERSYTAELAYKDDAGLDWIRVVAT